MAATVRELKGLGFDFDRAQASRFIRDLAEQGKRKPLFTLVEKGVRSTEKPPRGTEHVAVVKIIVRGAPYLRVAEGNGEINCLDNALRAALKESYPGISQLKLAEYTCRSLNGNKGSAARVEVIVSMTDGKSKWSTIGIDTSVIDASWSALVEAYEYGLLHHKSE